MTAGVLDRVPVDEITRRALAARPGKALSNVISGVFYGLAWAVVMLGRLAWLPLAFIYMSCDEGARKALGAERPLPDVAAVVAENTRLRDENARLDLAGMLPENESLRQENARLRQELARLS